MPRVDLSASIYKQYERACKRAKTAESKGAVREAAAAYLQAAHFMRQYAASTGNQKIRKKRLQRADALENFSRRLSKLPASPFPQKEGMKPQPDGTVGEDDYETQVLGLIERVNIGWQDIGGLQDTKSAIKVAFALAMAQKPRDIVIESWNSFLLYGPSGTGKTLLAAATAGNLDATFFNVQVSDVLSKYFGESTKLISALYTVARRLSPSVVFIDEFESISPPRGSGESGAERRIVATLLAELDGLAGKDDQSFVLSIAATNMPWLLDHAVLSRFQKRIYVPLPDDHARNAIFDILLTRRGHISEIPVSSLVSRTDGYSGREIERLCQNATMSMIQRTNPDLEIKVDDGLEALQEYRVRTETISKGDFNLAFKEVQPGTNPKLLRRYQEWMDQVEA